MTSTIHNKTEATKSRIQHLRAPPPGSVMRNCPLGPQSTTATSSLCIVSDRIQMLRHRAIVMLQLHLTQLILGKRLRLLLSLVLSCRSLKRGRLTTYNRLRDRTRPRPLQAIHFLESTTRKPEPSTRMAHPVRLSCSGKVSNATGRLNKALSLRCAHLAEHRQLLNSHASTQQ